MDAEHVKIVKRVPEGTRENAIAKHNYLLNYYEIGYAQHGFVPDELRNIIDLFGYKIYDGVLSDDYLHRVKYNAKDWVRMKRIVKTLKPSTCVRNVIMLLLDDYIMYYGTDGRFYVEYADDDARPYWKRVIC